MAINFKNAQLYLEAPRFDYTNTPSSQAQNAAGLVNIANSFKTNQENSTDFGAVAANGAANSIAKDATYMQQAGALISANHTAETMERIHKMKIDAWKKGKESEAKSKLGGSIGQIVGMGIGLAAGGPMGAAIGGKIGGTAGGFFA